MSNEPPLAHSPRDGVPPQTYVKHIGNVQRDANGNARRAVAFYTGDHDAFVNWVDSAAIYHDFGKLDESNQAVLRQYSRKPLPIAHEDAGVAELDRLSRVESVALVAAHHAGLFSLKEDILATQGRPFRQLKRETPKGMVVADYVDEAGRLDNYRAIHVSAGCPSLAEAEANGLQTCGFTRRLALSCLVDADHGDTARNYKREVETAESKTQWRERAAALQRYVDGLPKGKTEPAKRRNDLRRRVFESCRDAPVEPSMRACNAPVGSGKTTAVMAHLLRVAREKKLRHVFVVLPYTNIITQSVEVYRKSLVLDGERAEDIVAEHHHRADFEDIELRQLATLWKAPIIVTTAVQFFETLGSHRPSRLRKLHELPGSAVFVDEMHAAMPSHLWPQMWRWLETWTRDWGGHIVFASGSLPRLWEIDDYTAAIRGESSEVMPSVPDLVEDQALKHELRKTEGERVRYRRRLKETPEAAGREELEPALDLAGLVDFVVKRPGPRLLIVNTVQTAAVVAQEMRNRKHDVLHLSTALAPAHRDLVVKRIKLRLRDKITDWTLVATSCVEAGMDFSFRTGFRERASTASLLQISGRVSRGNEHDGAEVWELRLRDDLFRHNPALKVSQQALGKFTQSELNGLDAASLATCAMRREWTCGAEEKAKQLMHAEASMEYPMVAECCQVIDADTRTVVIDPGLAESIRRYRKVSTPELLRYSVQLWATKAERLESCGFVEPIRKDRELYFWKDDNYDADFLGYMAGVIKNEKFMKDNDAWII